MKSSKFKKNYEILWGLDFQSLAKISLSFFTLLFLAINLKSSIDSPLFIFLLIIFSIITAFIIKSARGDEISGYYSAFILHPFQELVYSGQANQLYKGISELNNIADVCSDYLKTPEEDMISVIKISQGFCLNRASNSDIECLITEWKNLLSEMHKNNILDSYFFTSSAKESMQVFIDISNYNYPDFNPGFTNNPNIDFTLKAHGDWYRKLAGNNNFIPETQAYLIIKQKNPLKYKSPLNWKLSKLLKKSLELDYSNLEEQSKLLKQKISSVTSFCDSFKLKVSLLQNQELQEFRDKFLLSTSPQSWIQDHGKFIENNFREHKYSKTYRFTDIPSTKEFWIRHILKRCKTQTSIAIHLETRNSQQDRFRALSHLKNSTRNKHLTGSELEANKKIFANLSKQPYSFDFSFLITITAPSIKDLVEFDRELKKPFMDIAVTGLDRQQIKNFASSLASGNNLLKDKEKIFADLEDLSSSFPLIDKQLGTSCGPLLGKALDDEKPVFFDEYDREHFYNRGINFIGDSGSGKTVSAKLSVKRRLNDTNKKFFIIDNTEDGWEFFVDYYSGQKIDIDTSTSQENCLFSPLFLSQDLNINDQVDKCLELFKLLQNTNTPLDYDEKIFLGESLKELYRRTRLVDLSDLMIYIRNKGSAQETLVDKWSKIFYPYCKVSNGIYSGLLDNKNSQINNRLVLFTFSKIHTTRDYHNASMFLISDFISREVQQKSQNTLIIDEAWKLLKDHKNPAGSELICHLARAGRGLGLGLWTISQKPSDIPPEIHSSASSTLCFQLKQQQDRMDMVKYANLNPQEENFLNSIHLTRAGNAFLKTTIDSGLIRMELDPVEQILTSSVREFSNIRKKLFQKNLEQNNSRSVSALKTVQELLLSPHEQKPH